jgi:iron(III) transport system substrate-binding protein
MGPQSRMSNHRDDSSEFSHAAPSFGRRGVPRRVTTVVVAVLATTIAACSSGTSGMTIVLYNGQHLQLTDALVAAFENQTHIQVRVRTNDGIVLADQLLQEGASSPADVYLTENSPELVVLDQRHRFARLPPSILNQIPGRFNGPTRDWVGMALRVSSLAYSPSSLPRSRLPASILDLSQPQWKGRVAVAPTDSDFPPIVSALVARYGTSKTTKWLAGLKRNAETFQDEESVAAAVNRGDVSCGLVNQYYWYRLQREVGATRMRSSLYYFPDGDVGSTTNISGAAVLASTSHRGEAEAFVRFLVSALAQRIIANSDDFEYPARPGVSPNGALPPLHSISSASLSVAALGNDQVAAKLIQQSGLI